MGNYYSDIKVPHSPLIHFSMDIGLKTLFNNVKINDYVIM